MDCQAIAKYVRVSPRKLDLLVKGIKVFTAEKAVARLAFINKSGSLPLKKVIDSALNNAKSKNLATQDLVFKAIEVTPAGGMKRFRAVSRGMAHTYKKRMSHIKVVLTSNDIVKEKLINKKMRLI